MFSNEHFTKIIYLFKNAFTIWKYFFVSFGIGGGVEACCGDFAGDAGRFIVDEYRVAGGNPRRTPRSDPPIRLNTY